MTNEFSCGQVAPSVQRRTVLAAGVAAIAGMRVVHAADAPAAHALQLPASVTLQYAVKARYRGLPLQSDATLVWRRDGARYHAEWRVRVPFVGERTQRSDGEVTREGIRPHEYVEQTNKRRSARFDYAQGWVHFSDERRRDQALKPGAQDRLTVSLQLGALLAADPARRTVGSSLSLPVVGVGKIEPWQWDVQEGETLQVAGHPLPTIRLARRPRKDRDSQITVWLAPAVGYLPVRMHVEQENGDTVDQQLSAMP